MISASLVEGGIALDALDCDALNATPTEECDGILSILGMDDKARRRWAARMPTTNH